MSAYPRVDIGNYEITIVFGPGANWSDCRSVHMVIDIGKDSAVIGIEILSLTTQLGANCLTLIDRVCVGKQGCNYSYEEESDSFYLHLNTGRSTDQKAIDGCIVVDDDGQIVGIKGEWKVNTMIPG